MHDNQSLESKCIYELKVGFLKGGMFDYIVTWLIYKGKSIRMEITHPGDTYPDWIHPEEPSSSLEE